jgi:Hypothetical glycosyl hydrolase 6
MPKLNLPTRQVHLDFHTSPLIGDLLTEWDVDAFADTMARAHVNSVTVFAKCHHGMSYYPTKIGQPHPALGARDLLGEQISALQKRGIRAPIYYTVGWEQRLAELHPDWRQMRKDGRHARVETPPGVVSPDRWWFMSYLHPEYLDYMKREMAEIAALYPVEGVFFDIIMYDAGAGFEDGVREIRNAYGLRQDSFENDQRFYALSRKLFAEAIGPVVLEKYPDSRLFFNSAHNGSIDAGHGIGSVDTVQKHWEIESLPSGFWGYFHFPRFARYVSTLDKPWLGMTGRFQRMWGDFGGVKPQAALEYECFRSQAYGGGNSVGDQLPPRGQLDHAAYELIGAVYGQCENAEPFYQNSSNHFDVGIMLASHANVKPDQSGLVEEGAVLAFEEMHYNPAVLDDAAKLEDYQAIVLTDTTVITPRLKLALERYYKNGGSLVIAHKGGFDENGQWALEWLPVKIHDELEMEPTYWRARPDFWSEAAKSDRVFYKPGLEIEGLAGTTVLVDRVLPYFKRTDQHFMSHFQAPPVKDAHPYPAVIRGERFVLFSDPIFGTYRHYGTTFYRDVLERVMHDLIGMPKIGAKLARSVLSVPRRKDNDLIITLLHYIPQRKSIEGDVIEQSMSFAGEMLHIPGATRARVHGGADLETTSPGVFALPSTKGRLLVEVPGYFAKS